MTRRDPTGPGRRSRPDRTSRLGPRAGTSDPKVRTRSRRDPPGPAAQGQTRDPGAHDAREPPPPARDPCSSLPRHSQPISTEKSSLSRVMGAPESAFSRLGAVRPLRRAQATHCSVPLPFYSSLDDLPLLLNRQDNHVATSDSSGPRAPRTLQLYNCSVTDGRQ